MESLEFVEFNCKGAAYPKEFALVLSSFGKFDYKTGWICRVYVEQDMWASSSYVVHALWNDANAFYQQDDVLHHHAQFCATT